MLNIGGFYRSCSSYFLGGTHFMVFFLCSYVAEAVKCRGRLFSKNFFRKLLPEVNATYSGRSSSIIRCVSFRKNFFRELLPVVHTASSGRSSSGNCILYFFWNCVFKFVKKINIYEYYNL